jgi:hypothetical protein
MNIVLAGLKKGTSHLGADSFQRHNVYLTWIGRIDRETAGWIGKGTSPSQDRQASTAATDRHKNRFDFWIGYHRTQIINSFLNSSGHVTGSVSMHVSLTSHPTACGTATP